MSRLVVRASSQYLKAATGLGLKANSILTLAAWYKPSSVANGTVVGLSDITSGNHYHALGMNEKGEVFLESTELGVDALGGKLTNGAWNHIAGVQSATNKRTAYVNGTAGTANTQANGDTVTMEQVDVGALTISSTALSFAGGEIAEVAVWKVALTAAQIKELAAGKNPHNVEVANLVGYWRLEGTASPEPSYKSEYGTALTLVNSPAKGTTNPSVESPEEEAKEEHSGTSSVSGGGSVSASGSKGAHAASEVSGAGDLTADGSKGAVAASAVSGAGDVVAAGAKGAHGVSSVGAGGDVSAEGRKAARGASFVSGAGSTASAGSKSAAGSSTVAGGGSVAASGSRQAFGTSTISGGGSVISTGGVAGGGRSSVSGGGSISSSGAKTGIGTSTVPGGGAIITVGVKDAFGSSTVSGNGDITSTGSGSEGSEPEPPELPSVDRPTSMVLGAHSTSLALMAHSTSGFLYGGHAASLTLDSEQKESVLDG